MAFTFVVVLKAVVTLATVVVLKSVVALAAVVVLKSVIALTRVVLTGIEVRRLVLFRGERVIFGSGLDVFLNLLINLFLGEDISVLSDLDGRH